MVASYQCSAASGRWHRTGAMDEPSSQSTSTIPLALPDVRRTRAVASSSLANPQGPDGSERFQWAEVDLRELQIRRRDDPPQEGTLPRCVALSSPICLPCPDSPHTNHRLWHDELASADPKRATHRVFTRLPFSRSLRPSTSPTT
jgi:hypothetical protein